MKRYMLGLIIGVVAVCVGSQVFAGNATNSSGSGNATAIISCDENDEQVEEAEIFVGGSCQNQFEDDDVDCEEDNDQCVECLNGLKEAGMTIAHVNYAGNDDDETTYFLTGNAGPVADRLNSIYGLTCD